MPVPCRGGYGGATGRPDGAGLGVCGVISGSGRSLVVAPRRGAEARARRRGRILTPTDARGGAGGRIRIPLAVAFPGPAPEPGRAMNFPADPRLLDCRRCSAQNRVPLSRALL